MGGLLVLGKVAGKTVGNEEGKGDVEVEKARNEGKVAGINAQLHEANMMCEELQNQLDSQRMEFSMFKSQAKAKMKA